MYLVLSIRPDISLRISGLSLCPVLLALLITIFVSPSVAEEGDGGALGLGSEPCRVFMSTYEHNGVPAHDDDNHSDEIHQVEEGGDYYVTTDYIKWLQGYLSGYNIHVYGGENVSARASVGGMLNFLYRRCSERPDDPFYTVLPLLLDRIHPEGTD